MAKRDNNLPPKRPARAAHKAGRMNQTEQAYAMFLESERKAGRILDWKFECVTLRLGDDCRYTPDFMVQRADGVIEFHEVKGHWEDDALVKYKAAAERYSFVFKAVRRSKKGVRKAARWEFDYLTDELPEETCENCRRVMIHMLDGEPLCVCAARQCAFKKDEPACAMFLRKREKKV